MPPSAPNSSPPMAPSPSKKSKQASPPSPNLLPGIAIGILAAVASGFAAKRVLQRKRPSTKDEEQTDIPPVAQEGEPDMNGEGSCAPAAREIGKPAVEVDPENHVNMRGVLLLKVEAGEDGQPPKGEAEIMDNPISSRRVIVKEEIERADASGTPAEIEEDADKLSACGISITSHCNLVDDHSKRSHRAFRDEEGDREAEEKRARRVADERIEEHGDCDGENSAGQASSAALLNGQFPNFLDDGTEFIDSLDLSVSGCNSLSDSASECSMQEGSSAPVRPIAMADDAWETLWVVAKPGTVGSTNHLGEDEFSCGESKWSSEEKGSKDVKEPVTAKERHNRPNEENLDSLVRGAGANVGHNDVHEEVSLSVFSDKYAVLKGPTVKSNVEGVEPVIINGRILSNTADSGDCSKVCMATPSQALEIFSKSDDQKCDGALETRQASEVPRVVYSTISNESCDDPCIVVGSVHNACLEPEWDGASLDGIGTICRAKLQPTEELLLDSHLKSKVDLLSGLSGEMHGLDSHGEVDVKLGKNGFIADNLDTGKVCGFESVDQINSNQTSGISAHNLVPKPSVESDEKFRCAESILATNPSLQEEMVVQCNGLDISMAENIENAIVASLRIELPHGDNTLDASIDILVLTTNDSEELLKETSCLDLGSVNKESKFPAVKSTLEKEGICEEEKIVREISGLTADATIPKQGEEDLRRQASGSDGCNGRIIESKRLDSLADTVSDGNAKCVVTAQILNDNILAIKGSIHELGSESLSRESSIEKKPKTIPAPLDVADTTAEDSVRTDKGYAGSTREDDFDHYDSARNVHHSFGSVSGNKEGELAEFHDRDQNSCRTQHREIEEMISPTNMSRDLPEIGRRTNCRDSSSGSTRRGNYQLSQGRAAELQSRGSFLFEVFRYLPVKIGFICFLIGLISLLVGLLLDLHTKPLINGSL